MTNPEPEPEPTRPILATPLALKQNWTESKDHELGFWRHWLATGGDKWPDEFRERLDPEAPVQSFLVEFLDPASASVRILDAGAGPLTSVGKTWRGHEVELHAVDALADSYDALLAEAGVEPVVRTKACETERLSTRFPPDHFDLCYARNSLDHGYDPLDAIRQLLVVVKPGCCVVLQHFINEAEKAEYHDLHQWNITVEQGDMIIWNRTVRHAVGEELREVAETARVESDGSFCTVVLRKPRQA